MTQIPSQSAAHSQALSQAQAHPQPHSPEHKGDSIWITGASSGIGQQLALSLAQQGHRIIASARSQEKLAALAAQHPNITPLAFDVTNPSKHALVRARLENITEKLNKVILNAGLCEYLDFPNTDWGMCQRAMDTNYLGSVNTLAIALPLLKATGRSQRSHIIGITSQATSAPFSRAQAYGASKAAFEYFLNSVRLDLDADGIDVTIVRPGFVDTPMTAQNDFPMPWLMTSEEAATAIVKGIAKRPRSFTFPKRLSLVLGLAQLMPGLWDTLMKPKAAEPLPTQQETNT